MKKRLAGHNPPASSSCHNKNLFICTGTFQVIILAPKTGKSGGVERGNLAYTYYCAEETYSIGPAACTTLIVEPGVVHAISGEWNSSAACEAEIPPFLLQANVASDMP